MTRKKLVGAGYRRNIGATPLLELVSVAGAVLHDDEFFTST